VATNLNAVLTGGTLQLVDNAAATIRVNSPITTVTGQVASSFYDLYYLVANPGPAAVTLPAATIWQVAIRNISGTNTISVTATPAGGAAWASALIIPPNGWFIYMATYSTNPGSGGITALSLGSSGANTYAEILLAA